MYHKILVPVDLSHTDKLAKALNTAIDMAKHYDATLCYVAVTNSTPSTVAHSPEELADNLRTFADEQGKSHGVNTESMVVESRDTAVELEAKLVDTIKQTAADLVVMASHQPGIGDRLHFIHSNGANIVKHTDVSVFIVR